MIKKKYLFVLLSVCAISLTSCEQVKDYKEHLHDYVATMKFHTGFNILQLTDIHWNYNSSTEASKRYLDKVFQETVKQHGNIDLVELTGDQFMLSNTYHVTSFIKFFEQEALKYDFKYTVIWGNHDRHGLYNPNWLAKQFKNAAHCIYIEPNDNLYGRSNFVINLLDPTDPNEEKVKWQIANLDSGASFSETSVSPFRDYDYIRKDQTEWFVAEHGLAEEATGGAVPVIAYYHIPQDENLKAYEARATLKNKFFKLEEFADNGNPEYASDFVDVAKEHGLKAAFMGHAHNVDWTVMYEGVMIGLGVKTGPELYFAHCDVNSDDPMMVEGYSTVSIHENFDLIGASLVTLKDGDNFDLTHLYLNERDGGDFVHWEAWDW